MTTGRGGVSIDRTDDGGVVVITIDRPERRNALGAEGMGALADAAAAAATGGRVRAVLVRARGPDFCAGGDLVDGVDLDALRPPGEMRDDMAAGPQRAIRELWNLPVPLVASVRGRAIGFGACVPLTADVVVASRTASFTFPFCAHGLAPDSGASWLLPRRIGIGAALAALLDGETFSAERALMLGLVSRVVDDEALEEVADATVDRLASAATVAASFAKRLVRRGLECSLEESLEAEADAMEHCSTTADFAEGLAAFRARRAPMFSGS